MTGEEQQEIMKFLILQSEIFVNKGEKSEHDSLLAQQLVIVTQWINSMLIKFSASDYADRVHLFILRGNIRKNLSDIEGRDIFYSQASILLRSLPFTSPVDHSQEIIKISSIIIQWQEDQIIAKVLEPNDLKIKKIRVLYMLARTCQDKSDFVKSKTTYMQCRDEAKKVLPTSHPIFEFIQNRLNEIVREEPQSSLTLCGAAQFSLQQSREQQQSVLGGPPVLK